MLIFDSPQEVQKTVTGWKAPLALVPTMGALHEGHLALVKMAKEKASRVAVSIFVNPLQFAAHEDLDKYPRTLERDTELLRALDVDLLFTPTATEFYPADFSTRVNVSGLTSSLCGASRPGHFEGVTTVCMKLFQVCRADFAIFGEKDFQQLRVIERMVEDLNLPIGIVRAPIVREPDGLAMSSRNRYLSESERREASRVPEAIRAAKNTALDTNVSAGNVIQAASSVLSNVEIDYLAVCSEADLRPVPDSTALSKIRSPHFFLAVKIGRTRLIDNTPLLGGTP